MEKQPKLFHQHLLIRAFVENPPVKEEILNQWLTELFEAVKMKMVIAPRSYYVSDPGNEGLTGSCNISTSHCAIHIWSNEKPARIEMDLYSCSCFHEKTILNKLKEWGLLSYHFWMIDRNDKNFRLVKCETMTEKKKEDTSGFEANVGPADTKAP